MFDQLLAGLVTALPDPHSSSADALVESAAVLHRFESAVSAHKHAYIGELYARYENDADLTDTGISQIDPWDACEAELGPALTITPYAASKLISLGAALVTRLPNVWDAFTRGELDLARVRTIADQTANVATEHIKEVERRVLRAALDGKAPLTGRRLTDAINKAIALVDADGLRRRRERKEQERHIWVTNDADGMAALSGSLPAADATFLTNRLGEMAKRVCTNDPRSFQARRADALMALAHGKPELDCLCTNRDCPNRAGILGDPRRPLVHIITTPETVNGTSDVPGWIDGFGIVDAALVRDIAPTADIRELTPPEGAEDSYRPSQDLADWARALHGGCQFPGCGMPAWESDLDHRDPHGDGGGQTCVENLGPFCRKHHRGSKTFGGWTMARDDEGDLTITSPLGFTYPVPPTGPIVLLGGEELPRDGDPEPPKRKRRTRKKQRADRVKADREQHQAERAARREQQRRDAEENPPPF